MNKQDIIAWRTIVEILKLTGYYDMYENEVSRIAKLLNNINKNK